MDSKKLFTERGDKNSIGFAIVKRVTELHWDKVWIEDYPEGGSVFYIIIPKA